jgi:predicted enzyme related to lactoylglutathione lyase
VKHRTRESALARRLISLAAFATSGPRRQSSQGPTVTNFISAILVHVADPEAGLAWYAKAFPDARIETSQPSGFRYLAIGGLQLELVQADEKVPSGAAGSVVYWAVADFDRALAHFQSVGAKLYRGPMEIDAAEWMAQFRDPWGNCFGIRGRKAGNA